MPSHRDDAVDSMPSPQLDKPNRPYRGCSRCSTISMILAEASFGAVLSAYLSAYQRRCVVSISAQTDGVSRQEQSVVR